MTQIRHMARINKLKTKAISTSTTRESKIPVTTTTKRIVNPGFQKYLAERNGKARNLQDIIEVCLAEIEQPVSSAEIRYYLKREGGIDISEPVVKYALDSLVSRGKAARHLETAKERALRADGVPCSPKPAHLFNYGTKARPRTVVSVVGGYKMVDPRTNPGRPKKQDSLPMVITSTQTGTSTTGSPVVMSYSTQTGVTQTAVDYLIDRLVDERTRSIRAELEAANEQLAALRKILGS